MWPGQIKARQLKTFRRRRPQKRSHCFLLEINFPLLLVAKGSPNSGNGATISNITRLKAMMRPITLTKYFGSSARLRAADDAATWALKLSSSAPLNADGEPAGRRARVLRSASVQPNDLHLPCAVD